MARRAILFGREGTLCDATPAVESDDGLTLIDGSAEAILGANSAGYQAIVLHNATNDDGLGDRTLLEDAFDESLRAALANRGARLDGIYRCPHRAAEDCDCRLPSTGLLTRLRDEMGVAPDASFAVSDCGALLRAAAGVGAVPVLVLTGAGRRTREQLADDESLRPAHVAEDADAAVRWILRQAATECR